MLPSNLGAEYYCAASFDTTAYLFQVDHTESSSWHQFADHRAALYSPRATNSAQLNHFIFAVICAVVVATAEVGNIQQKSKPKNTQFPFVVLCSCTGACCCYALLLRMWVWVCSALQFQSSWIIQFTIRAHHTHPQSSNRIVCTSQCGMPVNRAHLSRIPI